MSAKFPSGGSKPILSHPSIDNDMWNLKNSCTLTGEKHPQETNSVVKTLLATCRSSEAGVSYSNGLDARKPVFGGLRTTQAQTSLRIRAV